MVYKVLFAGSVLLAGLFLALPETFASFANYGPASFTVSRIVGILTVIFEGWWVIRKLQGK